jgi:hypothetical protein
MNGPRAGGDPYNTAEVPQLPESVEWDDSTVEAVTLETPKESHEEV